jgi:ribonuclease P protein component
MYTLKKEERLCNLKLIEKLYHSGSSFLCYPFKVNWVVADKAQQKSPVQVLFAVSKKRYKHAVDRNLVKRRMREAYRLYKQQFIYNTLIDQDKALVLSLNYIGKEVVTFDVFERKMIKLLMLLNDQVSK